ncbi:MAG: hypothetical protein HUJ30_06645, partial [Gammaproteobacteria bacterium]|nr:hypothetical protein [Gammaproteobacteria bacterium]
MKLNWAGKWASLRGKLYLITGSSTLIVLSVMFVTIDGLLDSLKDYQHILEHDVVLAQKSRELQYSYVELQRSQYQFKATGNQDSLRNGQKHALELHA